MARKSVTVNVDREQYELTQIGATEGLAIYSKLAKVLGPMLRRALAEPALNGQAAAGNPTDQQSFSSAAGLKLADIVIQGLEAMETELTLELAAKFAENSKVKLEGGGMADLVPAIFDQHFAGRYGHMTRWFVQHLKLNFADFLED